jgi:hypothetical protein
VGLSGHIFVVPRFPSKSGLIHKHIVKHIADLFFLHARSLDKLSPPFVFFSLILICDSLLFRIGSRGHLNAAATGTSPLGVKTGFGYRYHCFEGPPFSTPTALHQRTD